MKIKTKLTLGVGLLFILIILLSIVGARYINALKNDTENILLANYNSLEYSRNMLVAIEDSSKKALQKFETNLQNQEKNITEIGEKEATTDLRNTFKLYKQKTSDRAISVEIRTCIFKLMDLNMQAIQQKSEVAKATANKAVFWIGITGTICFLIAFTLLINLPSNIASPIKELTESIKQIADKKYSERVHFESHSEFGDLAKSFNIMAKKLEEYNSSNLAKLMKEKMRIETLINNMHDPVIGLDENLKVIFANEEAIKIIGMSEMEIIGHHTQELAVKNDLVRTLIQNLMIAESGNGIKSKPIKIYADNKEGYFEKETLHISIVPTGEQTKQLIGHVIILRNITEFKELDFAKTNFVANISHELKTPISSIKMSLQLLENKQTGNLNHEQQGLVESIGEDANRLLKITKELLNISEIESGVIQMSVLSIPLTEVVDYALSATKNSAEQKGIKIRFNHSYPLPNVLADSEKMSWVLTNLITNAIRYSHENSSIDLDIDIIDKFAKISVSDTGQGIPPQFISKIFDRYYRIPGSTKEGTGLGLSISKEFVEAQGGNIEVVSDFAKGSTFTITIPTA